MADKQLKEKRLEKDKGVREVRFSDSGITVVNDTLPHGLFRQTRVLIDGRCGQGTGTSLTAAEKAARKAVA